jgi:hypothetical protein
MAALLVATALALQTAPTLPEPSTAAESGSGPWAHAQRWLQQARGGASRRPGALAQLWLEERDLNALIDQTLPALRPGARARIALGPDRADLHLNLPLPHTPAWLNGHLVLDMAEQRPGRWPRIVEARLGHLPLPPSWVDAALQAALDARLGPAWRELTQPVAEWQSLPGRLRLAWAPDRGHWQQLAGSAGRLLPEPDRRALAAHHEQWQSLQRDPRGPQPVSLATALSTLARPALQRVQAGDSPAEAELRALLLTLALHSVNRSPARLLGLPPPEPPAPQRLRLADRDDLAQHFLLSAWLAWQGSEPFSQALGLGKELADAQGGSGFSFNDLAADDAGSTLGRLAAADPARLLAALASGLPEAAFFPRVDDLPEFLPEAEFQRRFGGVGGAGYEAQRRLIRERIAALPLVKEWR